MRFKITTFILILLVSPAWSMSDGEKQTKCLLARIDKDRDAALEVAKEWLEKPPELPIFVAIAEDCLSYAFEVQYRFEKGFWYWIDSRGRKFAPNNKLVLGYAPDGSPVTEEDEMARLKAEQEEREAKEKEDQLQRAEWRRAYEKQQAERERAYKQVSVVR